MKRLIFHVGTPKTGTSSIQAFLSLNHEKLLSQGIWYPNPESGATIEAGACSGNLLTQIVERSKRSDQALTTMGEKIDSVLFEVIKETISRAPCNTILFSGEFLTENYQVAVRDFKRLSEVYDVEVKVLIRDPYEQFISSWKHSIARGGRMSYPRELLAQKIATDDFALIKAANFLRKGLTVEVLRYEKISKNLIQNFLSSIGVRKDLFINKELELRHNVSLSISRCLLVVMTTRLLKDGRASALLARKFLESAKPCNDPYLSAVDSIVRSHCRGAIELFNTKLPLDHQLETESKSGKPSTSISIDLEDLLILFKTLRQISELPPKTYPGTDLRLRGLPADFDPLEYLIRNVDVEQAGDDPVDHYLKHGRYEGRAYKSRKLSE